MTARSRILGFGSAAVLVVAGALCAILIGGFIGQLLLIALMLAGFGGALLLLFFEVGLSEDRARAREEQLRRRRVEGQRRSRLPRWPRRPG